jgi:phenylacetic acid degradation operon negative regulatory protein
MTDKAAIAAANAVPTAAAELVARFRRQRPLRGGSLIVTIFGDSILPRGGTIALGSLIALAAPFGLNERLVRTATTRLAKDGWLEGRRAGKLSEYRLSPDGRGRFAEATRRIYSETDAAWSGRWTVVVVPPMRAAERRQIREELVWRGFGELSANVFAHPELDSRSLSAPRDLGPLSKVIVFEADVTGGDAPQRLVSLGWDLEDLGLRYQRFVIRFERILAALGRVRARDDEACFIVRTLLIHEYNWPGARAAALCRDIYAGVFAASEAYLSRTATRLDGPLPAPDPSVMRRFGGIELR